MPKVVMESSGRRLAVFCSAQGSDWVDNPVLTEKRSKGTKYMFILLLLQCSHSQAKLFSDVFRWEPHYVRANNLYGKSTVRVSFVVMNSDHKLSP